METPIELTDVEQQTQQTTIKFMNLREIENSFKCRVNLLGNGKKPIRYRGWLFDPETLVLRQERTDYEMDLEQTTTAAELLDWILHLARKPNMVIADILVLLQAVADARGVGSLQGRFCPWGKNSAPVKW